MATKPTKTRERAKPATDDYGRPTTGIYDPAIDDAIAADNRPRKPVHLGYILEVASNYLDAERRLENAESEGYSRELIIGLSNRRDHLATELADLARSPDGYKGETGEQVDKWLRLVQGVNVDDPRGLAIACVRELGGPFTITPETALVTKALYEALPRTMVQVDIEAETKLNRDTVGKCLEFLRRNGLVNRPHGERKGEALTAAGVDLAKMLPCKK